MHRGEARRLDRQEFRREGREQQRLQQWLICLLAQQTPVPKPTLQVHAMHLLSPLLRTASVEPLLAPLRFLLLGGRLACRLWPKRRRRWLRVVDSDLNIESGLQD